jgi:hypothetical protein
MFQQKRYNSNWCSSDRSEKPTAGSHTEACEGSSYMRGLEANSVAAAKHKINNYMKKMFSTILLISFATLGFAQDTIQNTLNELPTTGQGLLYKDGKIYVVITVLGIIFAGIIFYLIQLDKKISKLNKDNK